MAGVVKQGYVRVKRIFGIWKRLYMSLHVPDSAGPARLRTWNSANEAFREGKAVNTMLLTEVQSVDILGNKRGESVVQITRKQSNKPVFMEFSCSDEVESKSWMKEVNAFIEHPDNLTPGMYHVRLMSSPLLRIGGESLIRISDGYLAFYETEGSKAKIAFWPVACVRRFTKNPKMRRIFFEVGSNTETGAGMFLFESYWFDAIFNSLQTAVKTPASASVEPPFFAPVNQTGDLTSPASSEMSTDLVIPPSPTRQDAALSSRLTADTLTHSAYLHAVSVRGKCPADSHIRHDRTDEQTPPPLPPTVMAFWGHRVREKYENEDATAVDERITAPNPVEVYPNLQKRKLSEKKSHNYVDDPTSPFLRKGFPSEFDCIDGHKVYPPQRSPEPLPRQESLESVEYSRVENQMTLNNLDLIGHCEEPLPFRKRSSTQAGYSRARVGCDFTLGNAGKLRLMQSEGDLSSIDEQSDKLKTELQPLLQRRITPSIGHRLASRSPEPLPRSNESLGDKNDQPVSPDHSSYLRVSQLNVPDGKHHKIARSFDDVSHELERDLTFSDGYLDLGKIRKSERQSNDYTYAERRKLTYHSVDQPLELSKDLALTEGYLDLESSQNQRHHLTNDYVVPEQRKLTRSMYEENCNKKKADLHRQATDRDDQMDYINVEKDSLLPTQQAEDKNFKAEYKRNNMSGKEEADTASYINMNTLNTQPQTLILLKGQLWMKPSAYSNLAYTEVDEIEDLSKKGNGRNLSSRQKQNAHASNRSYIPEREPVEIKTANLDEYMCMGDFSNTPVEQEGKEKEQNFHVSSRNYIPDREPAETKEANLDEYMCMGDLSNTPVGQEGTEEQNFHASNRNCIPEREPAENEEATLDEYMGMGYLFNTPLGQKGQEQGLRQTVTREPFAEDEYMPMGSIPRTDAQPRVKRGESLTTREQQRQYSENESYFDMSGEFPHPLRPMKSMPAKHYSGNVQGMNEYEKRFEDARKKPVLGRQQAVASFANFQHEYDDEHEYTYMEHIQAKMA